MEQWKSEEHLDKTLQETTFQETEWKEEETPEREAGEKELQEKLMYQPKSAWNRFDEAKRARVTSFAEEYKDFLNRGKTERECTQISVELLKAHGFVEAGQKDRLVPGDKVYRKIKNKGLVAAVIGSRPILDGANILGAHLDSPRIDLKPVPLYENSGMVLMKTHYYGGIKKYQWATIPLALHGVIRNASGEQITLAIGEDEQDPIFTITELLVHLSQEQLSRRASEAVHGEELNALAGGIPYSDKKDKDMVRLQILNLLNEQYGIREKDFITAELSLVPAHKARDIGFDRAYVGAYGQDDRVCAYTSLAALLEADRPERTGVCLFSDKEEIGSVGSSGAQSYLYENALMELIVKVNGSVNVWEFRNFLANSHMLSSDVTSAFDPTYASAYDKKNVAFANCGVCLLKYTGSRGKSGASDAHSEFFSEVAAVFDQGEVAWQTGELGKVDLGGGGTIAGYMANKGMNVIDCGVPVLSMHAPLETTSKADIYSAYEGYIAFLNYMK